MLEVLALSSDSAYQAAACQVLEKWWIENHRTGILQIIAMSEGDGFP
jgi:hypothetical protein